jgi:hypothetical protein
VDRDKGSREWFKNSANHLPGNLSEKDLMIKEGKCVLSCDVNEDKDAAFQR